MEAIKLHSANCNHIKPTKIIDLKGKKYFTKNKLQSWAIQTNVAKVLTSIIPIYGIPQLITALMERVFNFVEVLHLIRSARALNLVVEALGGNKKLSLLQQTNNKSAT